MGEAVTLCAHLVTEAWGLGGGADSPADSERPSSVCERHILRCPSPAGGVEHSGSRGKAWGCRLSCLGCFFEPLSRNMLSSYCQACEARCGTMTHISSRRRGFRMCHRILQLSMLRGPRREHRTLALIAGDMGAACLFLRRWLRRRQ